MSRKLIIIESQPRLKTQRTFYVKARLRCSTNGGSSPQLADAIRNSVEAVIDHTWVDDCAISVTIGKAWVEDWNEIEDRISRILIAHVGWPTEDVQIVTRANDSNDTEPSRVIRVLTDQTLEANVDEWVGASAKSDGNA